MPHSFDNATAASTIRLQLSDASVKKLSTSLSAIEQVDDALWLAGDESRSLVRLMPRGDADYVDQKGFELGEHFPPLMHKLKQEMDLEALSWDVESFRLWFVGSHSLRRKDWEAIDEAPADAALRALGKLDRQENRYVLGSVKLGPEAGPHTEPVAESWSAVKFDQNSSTLYTLLEGNPALKPFMAIPSKENGFDIEGLAVGQNRLFLGLRGPVIRGLASVLQLDIERDKDVVLKSSDGRQPYRHFLLDLAGLGIRDLCVQGGDLLVLAGPTMKLDGPIRVYRWTNALKSIADGVVDGASVKFLFGIATQEGRDHAEGIALFKRAGREQLIVVYDSPSDERLNGGVHYTADLFDLP
ncbi:MULTISPECIES: DUF3616 domain-containing protein [Caballeronia]|uniref:DUF3616 domain-containing protein n=1 Tax=Caballeronia jiangsuensis TaxID=1458357 RepID=A0ABW9CT92_9BURK|nr:DUF3616 domain-containing protein [Caballeronia sp. GaOx3]